MNCSHHVLFFNGGEEVGNHAEVVRKARGVDLTGVPCVELGGGTEQDEIVEICGTPRWDLHLGVPSNGNLSHWLQGTFELRGTERGKS